MNTKFKTLIALLLILSLHSCGLVPNNSLTMNAELWRDYQFVIDGVDVNFQIPEGGIERVIESFDVKTSEINEEYYRLVETRYDARASLSENYHLTFITLGLSRRNCCSIKEIIKARADRGPSKPELILVQGEEWVFDRYVLSDKSQWNDGQVVVHYTRPFNEDISLYVSLVIRPQIVNIPGVVELREQALIQVVHSVDIKKIISKVSQRKNGVRS